MKPQACRWEKKEGFGEKYPVKEVWNKPAFVSKVEFYDRFQKLRR